MSAPGRSPSSPTSSTPSSARSLVEKFRGKPVPFSVMERAGMIGFVLVIMIFMLGLTNDIGRITGEGFEVR